MNKVWTSKTSKLVTFILHAVAENIYDEPKEEYIMCPPLGCVLSHIALLMQITPSITGALEYCHY